MGCEVIATGSKGNAVLLGGDMLIDCGVPFRSILGHCRRLKIVLLTHAHKDHFCPPTVRRLALERPALRWGVPPWLAAETAACGVAKRNIDVLEMGARADYGCFAVRPVPLAHDVPNCGYKIRFADGGSAFYATDTGSLAGVEAKGYSLYLVEANHGEKEILERIKAKQGGGKYCHEWDALKNHLSEEKALDWLYRNMGPASRYVLLHGHGEGGARIAGAAPGNAQSA